MSRSYRKPFAANCPIKVSAKEDKQLAARGMRRSLKIYLENNCWNEEDFLLPDRLECSHNEVYSWKRDGSQRYQIDYARAWSNYCLAQLEVELGVRRWYGNYYNVWPPDWYQAITRK